MNDCFVTANWRILAMTGEIKHVPLLGGARGGFIGGH